MLDGRQIAGVNAVYASVREILTEARRGAYQAINSAMVRAYWDVGRVIVEEEQKGDERAGYMARV